MTTTRTVANTAAPLVDPGGGTVRNGTRVQFTLVNAATLEPCSAFDATTGEEISGTKAVTTTSGVFSAALWPNDRGTPATKYLCTINAPNFTPFSGIVREEDLSTLDFVDFFSDGQVLTPAQIGLLYEHIADFSVHLTSAQNTFLDALNLPTLTAAHVNFTTGLTSNAQTQLDAKAPIASPAFTGNPTAPTPAPGDNDTSIATSGFVSAAIAALALSSTYQPLDSDLTAIAALSTTSFGRSLLELASAAAARTALGLVIGTNVQAWDTQLDSLASLSYGSNGGKVVRVNLAANGFELTTISAGDDSNVVVNNNNAPVWDGSYEISNDDTDVALITDWPVPKSWFSKSVRYRVVGLAYNDTGSDQTVRVIFDFGFDQYEADVTIPDAGTNYYTIDVEAELFPIATTPSTQWVSCIGRRTSGGAAVAVTGGVSSATLGNIDITAGGNHLVSVAVSLGVASANLKFKPVHWEIVRGL